MSNIESQSNEDSIAVDKDPTYKSSTVLIGQTENRDPRCQRKDILWYHLPYDYKPTNPPKYLKTLLGYGLVEM